MPDKKTTELPENTSLNNNDKIYHASAGGVSKFMRLSTLVNFIISLLPPSTGGDNVRVYLGRIAPADIPTTGSVGEYFINSDTKTYWQWTPDDSEDPEGPGSFQDTGDPVQDVEADTVPTLGSVNYVLSDGIYQALLDKANLNHAHSTSEAWLSDIINLLVSKSGFIDQIEEKVEQGTGISLSIVGGKLKISASGVGAEAGDFISIGGLPLDNLALAAEFNKYYKKSGWTTVTPIGSTLTLTPGNGYDDKFKYTEAGNVTIELDEDDLEFEDGAIISLKTIFGSTSHTITLPSGFVDEEGEAKVNIEYTGRTPGRFLTAWFQKDGSAWTVYNYDPSGGDEINLPIDISDVTGLQAELDDLQDQIEGLSGGGGGPAVAETYADIAARDADVANRTAGEIVKVLDASADATVDAGYAYYEFEGGTTWRKLSEEESMDLEPGSSPPFAITDIANLQAELNKLVIVIDFTQLNTTIRSRHIKKIAISSINNSSEIASVSYQLRKNDGTFGTARSSIANINSDIAALTSPEEAAGYDIIFVFTLNSGQPRGTTNIQASYL